MIDSFVFDHSGIISDDRKPVYEANMKVLEQYGKPIMSFEEWLPKTVMTAPEFFKNQGINDNLDKLFELYKKNYTEIVESGIKPFLYNDVNHVFDYLHRINKKIAILSSHPEENLIKEIDEYKLTSYISLILGSSKDKSEGLIQISERLETKLGNMLYITDTVNDIKAARKANVLCAAVTGTNKKQRGYHSKKKLLNEKPDFSLTNLYDLLNGKFLN